MKAQIKENREAAANEMRIIGDVAYAALNGMKTHEAVCAERYKAIIERLDKPGVWFARAAMTGTGLVAVLHIIDWIRRAQ